MTLEYVADSLKAAGIVCSGKECEDLLKFHQLLLDWNSRMDLTAVDEDAEIMDRHYIDSLMILKIAELSPKEGSSLIDVGTGAGFPGMILAIFRRDLHVTLLDSQQKRLNFLQAVIDELKLTNVALVHSRAEDGGQNPMLRQKFDMAVARAVAPMNVLCEYLLPYVKTGGKAVCWKGPGAAEETKQCGNAASLLGGRMMKPVSYNIPGRDWKHIFIPIAKEKGTPGKYPRKAGTPGREPLR